MKRLRIALLPCFALLIVTALSFHMFAARAAAAAPATCGSWSIAKTPDPPRLQENGTFFEGTTSLSTSDAWSVGYYGSGGGSLSLTEHWNGSKWSIVPSPNLGKGPSSILYAVSAVSSNDVWAVGTYNGGKPLGQYTLTEHWDGTRWHIVPSPNPGKSGIAIINWLQSVAAVSTNDVWAVGGYYEQSSGKIEALIEHWDGTSWSIVAGSDLGSEGSELTSVVALASNNVWAVGSQANTRSATLIEHWDGSQWSAVASPNVGASYLTGVSAVSANDIWAVGTSRALSHVTQTLIEHWDGSSWSVVASPNSGSYSNYLKAVTVTSASAVWAVGDDSTDSTNRHYQALIEEWNGSSWSVVAGPVLPHKGNNTLVAASAVQGSSEVWAVGYHISPSGAKSYQPLTEYYC